MKYSLRLVSLFVVTILVGYKMKSSSAFRLPETIAYRGIYVNKFDSILGNEREENALLNWCVSNNFNAISLYDLNLIMSNSQRVVQLARFIRKARVTFNIDQVAAVRGSSDNFIQTAKYDSSRTDLKERFSVYNLENEWWNNGPSCDFDCYTSILQTMKGKAKSVTPPITTETYMGWFKNPEGQGFAQANTLVGMLDRILVHDYRKKPEFGYMKSRLSFLGEAAYSQNKIIQVIVIFSAEHDSMQNYFDVQGENHPFDDAYIDILNQFNAVNFDFKNNVQLIGYQVYAYTLAEKARPAYISFIQ